MREITSPPLDILSSPPKGGLADVIFEHAQSDPQRVALGRKDDAGNWTNVTAAEFRDEVLALAKGLLAQGVRFGDRVAIMCRTRYEWTLFDFAFWTIGAQVVPIYPTSSAEQACWMLHDAQVSAAMVEHEDHAMTIGSVIDRLPQLRRLWQLNAGAVQELYESGAHLDDDVVHRHRQAVTPDTIATVIYTSGTTGRPKGCVITHGNLMFQADVMGNHWQPVFHNKRNGSDEAATLLFLPLSHVFGRMVELATMRTGIKLAHQPNMSAAALLPDLQTFRPTFILAVPYIFEKVFNAARRKAERDGKAGPFDKAVEVAVRYADAVEARAFRTGPGPSAALRMQHQVFDKLVYAKMRDALGGRVRHAMSGGSGMDRRLGLFFAGAGVSIYEGYGLSECSAAATANPPVQTRFGTVGKPIPGTTVHIADDGEVWLRGRHVFQGYLNDPKSTDQTLHEGWLATGDLGALDEDGYLTITGRKKEILVTSGGKSVQPSSLEERVREHPLVAQCIVVGNDRPYIAALVTLDTEAVEHWLSMRGKALPSPAELVRDPDLETEVRRAVVAANTLVSQAESIRTFRILAHQFTEEHGLLTPSLKLKRKAIEQAYSAEVEALYPG
ncbi:long-chain fatty acid--CoA ligase [Streptomyces sp. TS71-3]|uniref:AMP-dependent synthetase/ligase n=1 Tax=Streptomyces sp. TS71-3 TaxID=2733862 RepID=UPI001B134A3D|nr:AMP-dependent synthetase/ligase [Streptomyces sp. TS71-3]GHJ41450.1 long-chain acyl-CoA synthetase [Streptomyces sp. TS71-3]